MPSKLMVLLCGNSIIICIGMARAIIALVFCFSVLCNVESAKILAVFQMPSFSHFTLGFRLAEELAARGHQVTAINPFPQKTPIKNYKDVSVEENVAYFKEMQKSLLTLGGHSLLHRTQFIFKMGNGVTENTLSLKNVQELINSTENFDLVLIEHFVNDALIGLGYHFKAPVVIITSFGACGFNNFLAGNPGPASYVPNLLGTFTKHMNFWQRLQNLFLNLVYDYVRESFYLPKQREIFKKYISADVELDDVLYNTSLILMNSHVSVNDAIPHVPMMVEIGGYHLRPAKKLSEDVQKFLDEAKEGVFLFSMGSNLDSKDLNQDILDALLKAFSKIKQKVLWKFEADLPNLPKNVKIMKWLSQQDILAHPNVKGFITHGGLLSIIEAVYNGVPIIGVPVFGDQMMNVGSAVNNGYALSVPLAELSEEKLLGALQNILRNPKYTENAKRRSRIMQDQPLKPIDSAVFWIEHIVRHGGGSHLRSAGLDLKWYERELLDVVAFLSITAIVSFFVIYVLVKKSIKLVFPKTYEVSSLRKNK